MKVKFHDLLTSKDLLQYKICISFVQTYIALEQQNILSGNLIYLVKNCKVSAISIISTFNYPNFVGKGLKFVTFCPLMTFLHNNVAYNFHEHVDLDQSNILSDHLVHVGKEL